MINSWSDLFPDCVRRVSSLGGCKCTSCQSRQVPLLCALELANSFKDTSLRWENVDPLWPDYKVFNRQESSFYFWCQLSHSKLLINSAAQTKLLHGPVTACRLPGSKLCFQLKAARNKCALHKGNAWGIREKNLSTEQRRSLLLLQFSS